MTSDELQARRRLGTKLRGKWTLERVLGVGGMASAYVARHDIGRLDAVKILHPELARVPSVAQRFLREARVANLFRHPGVVEIIDVDTTDDGLPFLVMQLIDGMPLAEHAQREGVLDLDELLRLMDELLDALAAAHRAGIVHRDIKPDNLLVQHDGRLKLLDFGIARVRLGSSEELTTKTGTLLGTAAYMPPEQIRGLEVDGRADLFAVGATMFRLIALRRLHDADGEGDLLVRMATEAAPPLGGVAPGTPGGVCLIVDRALALEREHRYPDAETMQRDLRAVRAGQAPPYATQEHLREAERLASTREGQVPSTTLPQLVPAAWDLPVAGAASARTLASVDSEQKSFVRPIAGRSARWVRPRLLFAAGGALLFASLFFTLAIIATLASPAMQEESVLSRWIAAVIAMIQPVVGGLLLWMAWKARAAAHDERAMIVEFVRARRAPVTAEAVALALPVSESEARLLLEQLADAGTCRRLRDGQTVVYTIDSEAPAAPPLRAGQVR